MPEIVKAGPNTASYPMHAYMYEEIVSWERGVAAESAQVATQNRYKNYLSGPFKLWWTNYDAGRDEEPPPFVPEGFDAQMSADGLGFDLVGSGAPSGPPPTYKQRVVTPKASMFGSAAGAGPVIGLTQGELLAAKLYGEPLVYGGMKFLRVA